MESLNNRTYIMPEANIKPFFPAASDVASKRFPHTLTGLGNNKAVTTFIAVICFLLTANINAQTLEWVKTFGGKIDDGGKSIAVDGMGNVYTIGSFQNNVDFDPGPDTMTLTTVGFYDIYIQKFDAKGNFLWAKSCGGDTYNAGNSIAVDAAGNVYTTGYFQSTIDLDPGPEEVNVTAVGGSDIFILKLDTKGNFVWAKTFGGIGADVGNAITVDAAGNVYVTGFFRNTIDFDPGINVTNLSAVDGTDIFVLKLDTKGNFFWAKSYGGKGADIGYSIIVDVSRNVYTSGSFSDNVDFDPGKEVMDITAVGLNDFFVQKLDAQGNFLWAKSCGGNRYDYGHSIAIDAARNVYTTGYFQDTVDFDPGPDSMKLIAVGNSDVFIQKLDASGGLVWAKSFGGNGGDEGYSINVDAAGNVYTIGSFASTTDFDPGANTLNLTSEGNSDVFIQKLDGKGNFVWAISFGGITFDVGYSIAVDSKGYIYSTGFFENTVDFDPEMNVENLTSLGEDDIFVHKMNQTATGVADMGNGIDISFYPNPSNGFLHIALNEAVGDAAITVTDLQGKIIHSEQMSAATKSSIDIQAPNGVYFVHIKTAKGQSIMKFIKE
ncbi:MAG: SBBP repeat-containing protein [Candidatus Kapaibacterium sp.]|jgi:hypothetical protein